MRNALLVSLRNFAFAALSLVAPVAAQQSGSAAAEEAPSLSTLETWAVESTPAARPAQHDVAIADQRVEASRAAEGARIVGGASVASVQEPLSDTTRRQYERLGVQVGVRWPILGSRAAQERNIRDARTAAAQSRLRLAQARQDAIHGVRVAYVRHAHSIERQRIAAAFLAVRPGVTRQLTGRNRATAMLAAERMDLLALFDIVTSAQRSQRAAQEAALRDLSRLAGRPFAAVQTVPVAWPAACLSADAILADADRLPALATVQVEIDAARERQDQPHFDGLEGGISLMQTVSRDFGGLSGRSTALGIDYSLPLEWRTQRDAVRAQALGERTRSEDLLQSRRLEVHDAILRAQSDWQLRRDEVPGLQNRLAAAREALRVATLRLPAFDGDGYGKALMARYALYQAAIQVVDGLERQELAATDLLALGGDCPPVATDEDGLAKSLSDVLAELAGAAVSDRAATRGLSWYVWNGEALLDRPIASLAGFPAGTRRILVSFDAQQLQRLAEPGGGRRLRRLVDAAHGRRIDIDLLLGEPSWVRPERRDFLLAQLRALRNLPFDGLHLDFERSQLPEDVRARWAEWTLATLQAVHATVPWRLALTTHYREFQDTGFITRLRATGVEGAVAMIYVSDVERAAAIARPLLRAAGTLHLSIAQSVERTLGATESTFTLGRGATQRRWLALARLLEGEPAFDGIAVQSWQDFREAPP